MPVPAGAMTLTRKGRLSSRTRLAASSSWARSPARPKSGMRTRGRPAIWWQVPVGNMSLPDVTNQWKDNRVDYFFAHPDEVVKTNAFAMVFGAGQHEQTNPSTDGGNLVRRVQQLAAAGGQLSCQ